MELINRQAVLDIVEKYACNTQRIYEAVKALPPAQPDHHIAEVSKMVDADLISRQAAIEVLRNRWLKTRNYEGIGEDIAEECEIYLKTLPSAQPEVRTQMSSADCISRQAAIRFVKTECNPYGKPTLDFESGKKVIEHLKQMPSAQPDNRLAKIAELVEGTIDHFDLDDAMDLLYQIKEIVGNETSNIRG